MKRYVYLAGPIAALTEREAKSWREYVSELLLPSNIIGVSPLRCEPAVKGRYDVPEMRADPKFGSAKAINAKNWFDTKVSDAVLAYMPREMNERRISVGTIYELAWASAHRKPTILVTDDPVLADHPLIVENTGWILPTLDDAVDVLVGILHVYTEPAL